MQETSDIQTQHVYFGGGDLNIPIMSSKVSLAPIRVDGALYLLVFQVQSLLLLGWSCLY